jgi:hypothetical protein
MNNSYHIIGELLGNYATEVAITAAKSVLLTTESLPRCNFFIFFAAAEDVFAKMKGKSKKININKMICDLFQLVGVEGFFRTRKGW